MQRLNIEAARKQAGQDLLQTPNPGLPPSASGSGTPISLSTPDILNSIIAIANPFFESVADDAETLAQHDIEEPLEKKVFANLDDNPTSNSKHLNGGPLPSIHTISHQNVLLGSPMSVTSTSTLSETGVNSPPPNNHSNHLSLQQAATPSSSVESMRSKLIKDSLKLTIQAKRKNSGKEELDVKSELVAKRPKREEVELTYDFSISNDSIAESLPPPTKVPFLPYSLCWIDECVHVKLTQTQPFRLYPCCLSREFFLYTFFLLKFETLHSQKPCRTGCIQSCNLQSISKNSFWHYIFAHFGVS